MLLAAILVKALNLGLRALRLGHGSTLPGRLALRLVPDLWQKLAALPNLSFVLVSGTNGKTTTTHILHHLLAQAGWRVETNTGGANLESGLLTAVMLRLPLACRRDRRVIYVLEIDEAALTGLADRLRPIAVILTNLCRDQLDRYGELDAIASRIGRTLSSLGRSRAILNADDPGVARLGTGLAAVSYFGLDAEIEPCGLSSPIEHYTCEACRVSLAYRRVYLGHFGDWHCPGCGIERPSRRTSAAAVIPDPDGEGAQILLRVGGGEIRAHLPLPGLHNVYNALAAADAAVCLGLDPAAISAGLPTVTPCFGRGERQRVGERELLLFLIKNPTGANTVLETIAHRQAQCLWFLINDCAADGRDVSWLWDVDFEGFWARNGLPGQVAISGRRAWDMAVRLRYSDLPVDRILVMPAIKDGLRLISQRSSTEGPCFVLATYTSMLALRDRLSRAARW